MFSFRSRLRGGGTSSKYGQLDDEDGGGGGGGGTTAYQAGGGDVPGGPVHSVDHVEIDHGPQDWRR